MKYIFYYCIVTVLLFSNSYGQDSISFGIKAGLTNSNQLYEYSEIFILDSEDFNNRYGMYLGVFSELYISRHISFIIDLSYKQKGMIDEIDATLFGKSPLEFNNRLDFLTLSNTIKFYYSTKYITPYLLTGLKYDILIAKKISSNLDSPFGFINYYDFVYDKYNKNILGLIFGFGIETKSLICFPILIEWVFNHDLEKVRIHENLEIQNISNELRIGIKF